MKKVIEKLEIVSVGTKTIPNEQNIKYLHEKSKDIKKEDISGDYIHSIIKSMFDLMYKKGGIGIAAPMCRIPNEEKNLQLKIFVIDLEVEYHFDRKIKFIKGSNPMVFINPKIINRSDEKIFFDGGESNLCILNRSFSVERNKDIEIEYLNQNGEEVSLKVNGSKHKILSICIQHEQDHFDGILISDKGKEIK